MSTVNELKNVVESAKHTRDITIGNNVLMESGEVSPKTAYSKNITIEDWNQLVAKVYAMATNGSAERALANGMYDAIVKLLNNASDKTVDQLVAELVDGQTKENNLAIAKTLTMNVNGWVPPGYEAVPSTRTHGTTVYDVYEIRYNTLNTMPEDDLKNYLRAITGSERIPVYDQSRPLNTFVMVETGALYKLQANRVGSKYELLAYKVRVPYTTGEGEVVEIPDADIDSLFD